MTYFEMTTKVTRLWMKHMKVTNCSMWMVLSVENVFNHLKINFEAMTSQRLVRWRMSMRTVNPTKLARWHSHRHCKWWPPTVHLQNVQIHHQTMCQLTMWVPKLLKLCFCNVCTSDNPHCCMKSMENNLLVNV